MKLEFVHYTQYFRGVNLDSYTIRSTFGRRVRVFSFFTIGIRQTRMCVSRFLPRQKHAHQSKKTQNERIEFVTKNYKISFFVHSIGM